jgi:hypothetical protein
MKRLAFIAKLSFVHCRDGEQQGQVAKTGPSAQLNDE